MVMVWQAVVNRPVATERRSSPSSHLTHSPCSLVRWDRSVTDVEPREWRKGRHYQKLRSDMKGLDYLRYGNNVAPSPRSYRCLPSFVHSLQSSPHAVGTVGNETAGRETEGTRREGWYGFLSVVTFPSHSSSLGEKPYHPRVTPFPSLLIHSLWSFMIREERSDTRWVNEEMWRAWSDTRRGKWYDRKARHPGGSRSVRSLRGSLLAPPGMSRE